MKNLSYIDRLYIEKHQTILSKRQLALDIGCCLKTIYNEFNRGGYWWTDQMSVDHWRYSADIAQQDYEYKATSKGCPPKLGKHWDFILFIEDQIIYKKASPAVALSRWKEQNDWTVSVTTLYRYIDSGLYFPNLTNKHLPEKPSRTRNYNHVHRAKRPPKGTSIEKRPKEINKRNTFGHWEMDTVIGKSKGKNQAVLVLTERLTRYEIMLKLKDKTAKSVVSALSKLEKRCNFAETFKSITVDNGAEFQDCKGMELSATGKKRTTLYYCHPYTSSERGSNERMNRMIRRFYPKGSSFAKITQKDCAEVQDWLNSYPRKILGWRSPKELWTQYTTEPFL